MMTDRCIKHNEVGCQVLCARDGTGEDRATVVFQDRDRIDIACPGDMPRI